MAVISKLVAELNLDDKGFSSGLDRASGKASAFGGKLGKLLGVAAVAAGAAVITKSLYGIGSTFDTLDDTITTKTGATGKAFTDLENITKDVFGSIPTDMETAVNAVTDLSQKTGDTGKVLDALAKSEIELARISGTDLAGNIDKSAKIFNAFGVAAEDQVATLDDFFNVSQKTGVGIDQLMSQVQQFNPTLRQFGLTANQSALLIGKLDKAGLNVTGIMQGLKHAVVPLTKDFGTDLHGGLTKVFDDITKLGPGAASTAEAVKYFGAKAGPELAQAILAGTISVDDLNAILGDTGDTILDTAAKTNDAAESWKLFKNNLVLLLEPLGEFVFNGLNLAIPLLTDAVKWIGRFADALGNAFSSGKQVSTLVKEFPGPIQSLIGMFLTLADSAGDVVRAFSKDGLSGAFDALGPAIRQALSGLGSFAVDVAISVGHWVISQAVDLYGAVKDKIAGWLGLGSIGDGTQGPDTGISLGTLGVAVADWAISALVDLGTAVADKIAEWWPAIASAGATVAGYAVKLGEWLVTEATNGDLASKASTFAQGVLANETVDASLAAINIDATTLSLSLTKDKLQSDIQAVVDTWGAISIEAKQWEVILATDPTVDPDGTAQQSAQDSALKRFLTFNPIEWAEAKWNITLDVSPSIVLPAISLLNDALQASIDALKGELTGKGPHWTLEMDNPVVDFLLDSSFGDQVYDAVVATWTNPVVQGIVWTLELTNPVIAWDRAVDFGKSVHDKLVDVGDIDLSWPNGFTLDFATPVIDKFPSLANISGIAHDAYVALGDMVQDWPNVFTLNFAMPDLGKFPSKADLVDLVLAAFQDLGDMIQSWPNVFQLNFSMPSLGSFPGLGDIWSMVWGALSSLGDLSIPWPNGFSVNFPTPNVNIPNIPVPFAMGGITGPGVSLVGERGPELAVFPVGTRIIPAGQTASMMNGRTSGAGGDTYISMTVNPAPGMDEEALADMVMARFQREMQLRKAS